MQRLNGRPVIVTGAAQGIGAAIATRLHAEGTRVALPDISPAVADVTGGMCTW